MKKIDRKKRLKAKRLRQKLNTTYNVVELLICNKPYSELVDKGTESSEFYATLVQQLSNKHLKRICLDPKHYADFGDLARLAKDTLVARALEIEE
jgi:hypothetical protein